ncbi:tyrosine-type recombinase/integrase [Methylocapsa sp. D3K7]|uniref:tyrosine-type recombinase/integrase n=1 Tax=Methylocapsa sp. D3K7 TaxID=3041435 RepID=UPI00244E6D3A|nr:site-specific integrase [Methylocapsa sp. D3K7]WGJ14148.1 tyrosine-type recombinase/integrase [Methylocapsa sp. D3K7]
MARRQTNRLTARFVATAPPGVHCDGRGLYLIVSETLAGKWVANHSHNGKRFPGTGLGSRDYVGLAEAREKNEAVRKLVKTGGVPAETKREAKRLAAGTPTFGQCADELLVAKASEWRHAKTSAQWRMTLERYAKPLWALPVDEIDTRAVLSVLQPLWVTIPETAARLRNRIEAVLNFAKAHKLRAGENPAAWRGHLALILPKRQKLTRGHHAALPYRDVREFIAALREIKSIPTIAFEFLILTAARSGTVLGARWSEIDLVTRIWVVPAARMKSGVEHRTPLSARATEILEQMAEIRSGDFVFPGQRRGRGLGQASLWRVCSGAGTPHGFRSTFRDWCGEETSFPREVAEAALAHVAGDATERAYRRGDALEKRRGLMEAWAAFCEPKVGSNVVSLSRYQGA